MPTTSFPRKADRLSESIDALALGLPEHLLRMGQMGHRMNRSRSEVIEEIERFLNEESGAYDWDDFVTLQIRDPKLDAIRTECYELRDKYPPEAKRQYCSDEGLAQLRQILNQLRMEEAENQTS